MTEEARDDLPGFSFFFFLLSSLIPCRFYYLFFSLHCLRINFKQRLSPCRKYLTSRTNQKELIFTAFLFALMKNTLTEVPEYSQYRH